MKTLVLNLQELLNPINQMTYVKNISLNFNKGEFWVGASYSSFEMYSHALKPAYDFGGGLKCIVDRNKFAKALNSLKKLVYCKDPIEGSFFELAFLDEWISLKAVIKNKRFEATVGYVSDICLADEKPGFESRQICELNKNDLKHLIQMGKSLPYETNNITRNIYFCVEKGILNALVTDGYFLVTKPICYADKKHNGLYFNADLLALEKCAKNSKTLTLNINEKENKVVLVSENSKAFCNIFKNTLFDSALKLINFDDCLTIEYFDLHQAKKIFGEAPRYYPSKLTFYEKGISVDSEYFSYNDFSGKIKKEFGVRPENFLNMVKAMNISKDICADSVTLKLPKSRNGKPMVVHCGYIRAALMPYELS